MADLWAVHATGMDDIHPCASRHLAVRNANWLNLALAATANLIRYEDDTWPLVFSVPVVWEGSAQGHAQALAREDSLDPRWSDPDADVVWELAEEMLRLRDADA